MHWLKQFRESYVRKDGRTGLSKKEFAALVRDASTGCSEALIGIVENGGITHPGIARRIAKVTGCTADQYNGMVHKMHHGGWDPAKNRRRSEFREAPRMVPPALSAALPANARAVVTLNRAGSELRRDESMSAAAQHAGRHISFIRRRCGRQLKQGTDEFREIDCTFRFADEWDSMTQQQRDADMYAAKCSHKA